MISITILDLHDRIDELATVLREQLIDCSFVERTRRLIESLPLQAQVQRLNLLIVRMRQESGRCGTLVPSSSGGSTDCSTAAGRGGRCGLPADGAADPN
jgi:hypothetical protein